MLSTHEMLRVTMLKQDALWVPSIHPAIQRPTRLNQPVEGEFVVIEFTLAQRKAKHGEYLLFLSDCDESLRTDAQAKFIRR